MGAFSLYPTVVSSSTILLTTVIQTFYWYFKELYIHAVRLYHAFQWFHFAQSIKAMIDIVLKTLITEISISKNSCPSYHSIIYLLICMYVCMYVFIIYIIVAIIHHHHKMFKILLTRDWVWERKKMEINTIMFF